ncbi:hypothetical protein ACP70R_013879 [Stipagrostis hirtigluma subsp. patula]
MLLVPWRQSPQAPPSSAFSCKRPRESIRREHRGKGRLPRRSLKVAATRDLDEQQDIARGKGLADALFQVPLGRGTHAPVMSSQEYTSQGMRQYSFDNTVDGYYIAPAFMDRVVVHIVKNFIDLPSVKVPLILGIWGSKGQASPSSASSSLPRWSYSDERRRARELQCRKAADTTAWQLGCQ